MTESARLSGSRRDLPAALFDRRVGHVQPGGRLAQAEAIVEQEQHRDLARVEAIGELGHYVIGAGLLENHFIRPRFRLLFLDGFCHADPVDSRVPVFLGVETAPAPGAIANVVVEALQIPARSLARAALFHLPQMHQAFLEQVLLRRGFLLNSGHDP